MKLSTFICAVMIGAAPFSATAQSAAAPTCTDIMEIETHGQHVVRDYVTGGVSTWPPSEVGTTTGGAGGAALPGGPGAGFHLPNGIPPGASFCVDAESWHALD